MSSPQAPAAQPDTNRPKKRLLFVLLGLALLAGAVVWAIWYISHGRWQIHTDDAYVHGDLAPISSLVDATVVRVLVQDGDFVPAGTPLLALDSTDAEVALAQAQANLAQALRQSKGLYTQARSASSGVTAARAAVRTAQADLQRLGALARQGMVTKSNLNHAEEKLVAAQSALAQALEAQSAQHTLIEGTALIEQPAVEAAAAQVRAAYLRVQRSHILSPVDGFVAKRSVQVGQLVKAGQPLLAVAALGSVWVEANYKETQLKHLRIGQPVHIVSDLYGKEAVYAGRIESLGMGTGSVFSILPAQNATGNWIKVTQRLPVRIALDPTDSLHSHPLRLGLSVVVTTDTHERSGALLPDTPRQQAVQETDIYAQQLLQADALVERIIAANTAAQ